MRRESEFTYTNGRGGMFALKFDTLHPILQRKHGGDNPHVSNAHTYTHAQSERIYANRGAESLGGCVIEEAKSSRQNLMRSIVNGSKLSQSAHPNITFEFMLINRVLAFNLATIRVRI